MSVGAALVRKPTAAETLPSALYELAGTPVEGALDQLGRRRPLFSSRPSRPLLATTLAVAVIGIVIPYSPVAGVRGFQLPRLFLAISAAMAATALALAELGRPYFFPSEGRRDERGTDAHGAGSGQTMVSHARQLPAGHEKAAP